MEKFSVTFANGELSRLELISVLRKLGVEHTMEYFEDSFCIVEADDMDKMAKYLGGSFKIGQIAVAAQDENSFIEKLSEAKMFEWLDEKASWGLSLYGINNDLDTDFVQDVQNMVGDKVREAGARKAKKILPDIANANEGIREISSGLVTEKSVIDIQLLKSKNALFLAITEAVIPSTSFQERDLKRPYQDSTISLSPRIARMLVNMTMLNEGQTLLDPFCGTGTILMEAAILNINVMGFDKDWQRVKGAIQNIKWLRSTARIPENVRTKFHRADARDLRFLGRETIDAIATEPILLPSLERFPSEEEAKGMLLDSFKTYREFLKNAEYILKRGAKIALIVPYIRLSTRKKAGFDIQQLLEGINLQIARLAFNFPILARYTQEQKVIRGVLLLEKP
jgi:tRNA G10  N-methylase Trm11